jgi:predicted metalloendopeptidase
MAKAIDRALFDTAVPLASDFYDHVNGGWLAANPVPPEYGSWGAFHEVNLANQELLKGLLEAAAADVAAADAASLDPAAPANLAGRYYAAAMDEAAIAAAGAGPLADLLARVDAVASPADVRELLPTLQRFGIGALHGAGIEPDFDDSTAYLVYLGQGGLGLPERDYYTRTDDASVALRAAYVAHVTNQLANLGIDADAAADAAERILAFETRLAEPSYPAEKMRDVQLTLNRFAVDELDTLMPGFGLAGYVRELGVTQPSVSVDNPGFFTALDAVLADTPAATMRDYLRWHVVRAYAGSLSPAFENEAFDFYGRQLGGQQQLRPRWKRVLDAASADIGEAVAQLYVDAAFSEAAKHRCEAMVDNLLAAMGDAIRGVDWMGEDTKARALEKLAGFGYKIGFPDAWRSYAGLELGASHAGNRMAAAAFEHDRQFARLLEPVDTTEWAMPAHTVNAYYHPLLNEIVFPAGILQPPFFFADADDAVNFGAIGAVIGHEITHGFDDQGSRFDAHGHLSEWWTESDRAEFERRAAVLIEQFDGFEILPDVHVNGRLTLGENIADLGGVTVALAALHAAGGADGEPIDGFTPVQRFFLAYAAMWRTNLTDEYARLLVNIDPHSPARFRVNAPLSNLPAFAEAFDVEPGTPMARGAEGRAKVW